MCADCIPEDNANNLLKCVNIWQPPPALADRSPGVLSQADHLRLNKQTVVSPSGAFKDSAADGIACHLFVSLRTEQPRWSLQPLQFLFFRGGKGK